MLKDNGYMSMDEINILITDTEYNLSVTADEPTIYSGDKYGFRTLFYNIRINGIAVARLCVDEILRNFADCDFALIEILASYLEKALKKQNREDFNRPQDLDEILNSLLGHRLVAEKRITSVLENLHWEMYDTYFCLLLMPQVKHDENILNPLAFQLIMFFPSNCYTVFDNKILFLFNLTRAKTTRENVIALCPPVLRDNLLKAGISTEFHDFKDLYYYYLQAQSALELGQKEKPSFWYYRFEDYNLHYLIEKCSAKQIGTALIPDGLKKLMRYDERKGTNYTKLLQIYLNNNMNIAETIRQCYLHRNTFLYRIEKIKEISQLDLENADTRLHLQISYKILELKKTNGS